mgnify:CR=1 FL=1
MPQRFTRTNSVALVAGIAITGGLAACSAPAKEAPVSTSPTSSAPKPSPTNKGIAKMPPQAFNPSGNAADGVLALESQGYTVVIQNGGGDPGHRNPLSQCKIASVDGLRGDAPPANTTVYLTVSC